MSSSAKKPYEHPPIEVGRTVNWYSDADPNTPPTPAKVTQVGGRNIAVAIFHPSVMNHNARDGVMHIDDPRARDYHSGSGAWDYTEWDKWLMDVTGWNEHQAKKRADAEKAEAEAQAKKRAEKPAPKEKKVA